MDLYKITFFNSDGCEHRIQLVQAENVQCALNKFLNKNYDSSFDDCFYMVNVEHLGVEDGDGAWIASDK